MITDTAFLLILGSSSDHQLCEAVKSHKPSNLARYVTMVIDDIYIKAGLLFNKETGALVGFYNLGEVNNLLGDMERFSWFTAMILGLL